MWFLFDWIAQKCQNQNKTRERFFGIFFEKLCYWQILCKTLSTEIRELQKIGKNLFFSLSYDSSSLGEALVLAKHLLFSAIFNLLMNIILEKALWGYHVGMPLLRGWGRLSTSEAEILVRIWWFWIGLMSAYLLKYLQEFS